MNGRVLLVIGTRPEAIKLAPVVSALQRQGLEPAVCLSGQHREILGVEALGIRPNYELRVGVGSLASRAGDALSGVASILRDGQFAAVVVQGDTTTAFATTIAAFYAGVHVGHVEAGLRTGDLSSPWPEEGHRAAIDRLSTWLFAPSARARDALLMEGADPSRVWLVGNTGIDALRLAAPHAEVPAQRTVLITVHRRENQGSRLLDVCRGLQQAAARWPNVRFVFPVHPNPEVFGPVHEALAGISGIELVAPLDHATMAVALASCSFVATDSGGLQEEAPYLGKPVLILRETTERPEGIEAGTARLVGTSPSRILTEFAALLDDPITYASMAVPHQPYGDGYAADRIAQIMAEQLHSGNPR